MTTMTLCVGIDVHLDDLVVRAIDKADGHEVLDRFRVTNNLPGRQAVMTTLANTATQLGYTRLEVGWEATGLLWLPFHQQLTRSANLHPFQLQPICFNPKLVANFKDGLVLRHPTHRPTSALRAEDMGRTTTARLGTLPAACASANCPSHMCRATSGRACAA